MPHPHCPTVPLPLPRPGSFFTDAYDLYMVGVITPMIAFARFPEHVKGGNFGNLPDDYDLTVKGMAMVGTLVGRVGGWV